MGDPLTLDVPIGFTAAKRTEARNLRLLGEALVESVERPETPPAFARAGYEVLGISPDKPEKLAKFRERDGLTITLLSDPDKSVMKEYAAFGEKKLYGKTVQGVIRSTFVVDEQGKVEVAQYNVKATGHVAKLRRLSGLRVELADLADLGPIGSYTTAQRWNAAPHAASADSYRSEADRRSI